MSEWSFLEHSKSSLDSSRLPSPRPFTSKDLPTLEKRAKASVLKRPEWMKVKAPGSNENYTRLTEIVHSQKLHTVCESAHCPNLGECWGHGTATFMILGNVCTRSCGFCAVQTGRPGTVDENEPRRVAEAIAQMGLRYAVITSVNRDELPNGGALLFSETINEVRRLSPDCRVEVLIPDFRGSSEALDFVLEARPDVLNHNIETVPRLYQEVRPQARYDWSLFVIRYAREKGMTTKSGLMVGLGESRDEVVQTMQDLAENGCQILTIGQYLQPTLLHLPIDRYWHPDEFQELKTIGLGLGFQAVEAGPLVRSSYHADETAKQAKAKKEAF